ncbi:MAG TPA: hypothetical protein VE442_01380 [Jatrophihabitans sp.]|jgi:hypothetical protein|nr:hypothetical protein [Jatrophihabitans sp.]
MSIVDARRVLDRFLRTDPSDVGCGQAVAMLHAYVELVVSGENPDTQHPGIAAHLQACAPCLEDYDGLLLTVRETGAP